MANKKKIANVLANRYASAELAELWSPEHKIVLERRLWIAVLKAQAARGIEVPEGTVEKYEAVIDQVDLDSIAGRERVTRHDVKARIEEFCALAGTEHIHKGMTSRDLTENVEQLQILQSLQAVRDKAVAVVARTAEKAAAYQSLVMAGRSRRRPRWASASPRRPTRCCWASSAWRTSSTATRCAASRVRWAPPRTCSTSSTATRPR